MGPEDFAKMMAEKLQDLGHSATVLESPNDHVISIEYNGQTFFMEVVEA